MRVAGIDHVVLPVTDLDRSIEFYCGVLGCVLEWRRDAIGLVHLRAGPSLIDLSLVDGASTARRAPEHLCLRITDFDPEAVVLHLRHHGVNPGEPANRYGATGYGHSIYLNDPDGNMLELRA